MTKEKQKKQPQPVKAIKRRHDPSITAARKARNIAKMAEQQRQAKLRRECNQREAEINTMKYYLEQRAKDEYILDHRFDPALASFEIQHLIKHKEVNHH